MLDRAAHLRTNDEKLFALEGQRDARAYVIYRDSLVVKQEASGPRVLLGVDEAVKLGANPGTIFLGLRDGAPMFGMGIAPPPAEKLIGRDDVAVTELRGMAMQGVVPPEAALGDRDGEIDGELASAPRLLRQLRHPHRDEGRRLEARMPAAARPSIFRAPIRS